MSSRVIPKATPRLPPRCKVCEEVIPPGWHTYCSPECLTAKRGDK